MNILKKMTFRAKRDHCQSIFRYFMGMQDSVLLILLQCIAFSQFLYFLWLDFGI